MRWLALATAVLGAVACTPNSGGPPSGDGGIQQAPIAIILNPQTFVPASIQLDFSDDLVVAEFTRPVVDVLDECSLTPDEQLNVIGAPSPWSNPQIELGAEANGYLYFGTGSFYFVNMAADAVTFLFDAGAPTLLEPDGGAEPDAGTSPGDAGPIEPDAGAEHADAGAIEADAGLDLPDGGIELRPMRGPVLAWAPLLDVPGVIYADIDGAVHRVHVGGGEDLVIPPADGTVESVVGGLDGHIFILSSTDGQCTTIRTSPAIGSGTITGSFGSSPCFLGIANQAGAHLWVAGQTDGGAMVTVLAESTLADAGPVTTLTGITPQSMVLAVDGSAIALLGPGPTYTVALSLTSNILQGLDTGDQGPWRLATVTEVPSATGGLFDDTGALYVADPSNSSIDIIQ